MTKFAVCFLLVFGELAFGGAFALAIPPFFEIERGFYKSSAAVYLSSGLVSAVGLGLLAIRAGGKGSELSQTSLWFAAGLWALFCIVLAMYLATLWTENGRLRARLYALALAAGLMALIANVLVLEPASFGIIAGAMYALTAITSALVLGLVSGAMLFGHWYLIDPNLPVDYLRTFVRLLGLALVADLIALMLAIGLIAIGSGPGFAAIRTLFDSDLALLATRLVLGPIATLVLVWMCWQTLKIPQTMAATGLLYIAVMSALVGEMLGRFILFRTAVPL